MDEEVEQMSLTEEVKRVVKTYGLNNDLEKEIWYIVDCVQKEMICRFNKIKLQDQFIIELAKEIK